MIGYNTALQDKKLRKKFFTKIALIRILKNGYGVTRGGYVVPKKGKLPEFRKTLIDTLTAVGVCTNETEKEINKIIF